MKKILFYLSALALFALIGFLRDFIFKNTNIHLEAKYLGVDYSTENIMDVLNKLSYWKIYILKWVLTVVFACLFYISQLFILRKVIKANFVKKWLNFMYIFLILLSALTLGIGWLADDIERGYTFSRIFMGILQSPLPIMFLLPVAISVMKTNEQKTN